jgi:LemA protein
VNSLQGEGGNAIFSRLSDEMSGSENRIRVERIRYNDAVMAYNRTAHSFPILIFRPLFRFPAQKPYLQAEAGAHEVPKF